MDLIYAQPNDEVRVDLDQAPTGLANVGVRVLDGNGNVVVPREAATELVVGSGLYTASFAAPAAIGTYTVFWDTGTVTPTTTSSDTLVVNGTGAPVANAGPGLITLTQLKTALGYSDVDPGRDARLSQAILGASAAISAFCDREFGVQPTIGTRNFEYDDGSGYVDIDDCSAITDVSLSVGGFDTPLDPTFWRAEPADGVSPVFTYLHIPYWISSHFDPSMGFTRNLDVISKDRGWPGMPPTVKVTATWGWPVVPADVQQATIWTAVAMSERPSSYVSEHVADYSYTTTTRGDLTGATAIPGRAQDLLAPYVRLKVG